MYVSKDRQTATAIIAGSSAYPDLYGTVRFRQMRMGVLVTAEIHNLPTDDGFFGFHIHEGDQCTDDSENPFESAGGHYNPQNREHPYHAGDLPPLLNADGYAYLSVLTDRFTVQEIVGRTVVVHLDRDDFTTQPSGGSGVRIGCGVIEAG
ncbi:MAG: superoxide dismutase family protein [Eubacteriales bacterium]